MTIGPVQMLVLGFDHPNFQGRIRAELDRLRDDDMVRVIDFLAVQKAVGGEVSWEVSMLGRDRRLARRSGRRAGHRTARRLARRR
ncbi:hypothetical protein ACQP04_02350 [Pseudonocardia halophobica]|uniref:hypothetical protein n=1 Tax=Pseudonocardia halophobica TaxID=29401 RepID=UPI003D9219EE